MTTLSTNVCALPRRGISESVPRHHGAGCLLRARGRGVISCLRAPATRRYSNATALTVSGHCVTGDSRLTYRRRKKKGERADEVEGEWEDSDYIYGALRMDDGQGGEEIASL